MPADNTVMTRTFSKIFGLGGMRLGWAYAPANVVDVLNRVRMPFNVNAAVQAAGIAALNEPGWVERGRAHNTEQRARLAASLTAVGIKVWPSEGNFVLADFATPDRADSGGRVLAALGRHRPWRRQLRTAALPPHHDRHGGGGFARGRCAFGLHGGQPDECLNRCSGVSP